MHKANVIAHSLDKSRCDSGTRGVCGGDSIGVSFVRSGSMGVTLIREGCLVTARGGTLGEGSFGGGSVRGGTVGSLGEGSARVSLVRSSSIWSDPHQRRLLGNRQRWFPQIIVKMLLS